MEDILNSIKAFLYDRASSPLFGAFVISWVGWNYRLVTILFSDEKHIVKFSSIDEYIKSHAFTLPWSEISIGFYGGSGIIFPLLTALTYIYLYPLVAEPVYKYSLKRQRIIGKLKKEANDSRIIDEHESRKLFKDLADMQSKYNTDISQYQKQVDSLKTIIDEQNKYSDINKSELIEKSHPEIDQVEDKTEGNNDIVTFKPEFEKFLRRFELEWSAEKESAPPTIDDAQDIISSAIDELIDYQSQITTDPAGELVPFFTSAIKKMKPLTHHRLSIDGGKSYKEFWDKGDAIFPILKVIPQILSKS